MRPKRLPAFPTNTAREFLEQPKTSPEEVVNGIVAQAFDNIEPETVARYCMRVRSRMKPSALRGFFGLPVPRSTKEMDEPPPL
jgi:hypothetical protein